MTTIHPTAYVSKKAILGDGVQIGPFCVINDGVQIGDNTHLASRVDVHAGTVIGSGNIIHEGTVVGGNPQHVNRNLDPGGTVIGDNNTFRENCTIHRALDKSHNTVIGNDNLLMVNAHVAHDCIVGNNTIIVNNVMLGGHVKVDDFAYISGAVAVHQFCRVGSYVMVGGQSHITQDVPPYVTVDGNTSLIVGLNIRGLRRKGFSREEIADLKEAYRIIYRQGLRWDDVIDELKKTFPAGRAAAFHEFFASGDRGYIQERATPRAATIKIRHDDDTTEQDVDQRVG